MTTLAQAKQQLAEAQARFERIQSRGARDRKAELDAKAGTCMDCGRSLSTKQGGRSKILRNGRLEIRCVKCGKLDQAARAKFKKDKQGKAVARRRFEKR